MQFEVRGFRSGDGAAQVVRIVGADRRESRRALEIVREKRDYLVERWNDIHG